MAKAYRASPTKGYTLELYIIGKTSSSTTTFPLGPTRSALRSEAPEGKKVPIEIHYI